MAPAHRTGQKRRWTNKDNRDVMRAYYKSSPTRIGYRKRMLGIWREEHPMDDISEERLTGQRRDIMARRFLSEEELQRIQGSVNGQEIEDQTATDADNQPSPINQPIEVNQLEQTTEMTDFAIQILQNLRPMEDRERLPPLKGVDKKKLNGLLETANEAIDTMDIPNLTTLNNLAYAVARTVTIAMGVKFGKGNTKRVSPAIERIQRKISKLQRNLSQLEAWKAGKLKNEDVKARLQETYHIKEKTMMVVAEEMKQRIVAEAAKLQRYNKTNTEYQQNKQFRRDQKRLFAALQGKDESEPPNKDESVKFWSDLWGQKVDHKKDAQWILKVRKQTVKVKEQPPMDITYKKVANAARRMKNWKAPGPDQVHGFWIKKLTSLHPHLVRLYQSSLDEGCPAWMTTGRTVLLQKDKTKGTVAENYRPITCLPTMWKLLSGILATEIQCHLTTSKLLPLEQKGCANDCRGVKDQLLVDKAVVENCKRRKTNLEMAWVDYKKAYDRVPHSWILECLDIYKVDKKIKDFLQREMRNWKTELISGGESLGQVPIHRGIFQGDNLSPLLYIMAMIPISSVLNGMKKGYEMEKGGQAISHLLYMDDIKHYAKTSEGMESMLNTLKMISSDIGMEFGLDKCARVSMKRGKIALTGDLPLYDGLAIKELDAEKGYKYLGILQTDLAKKEESKASVMKEYFRRTRLVLKSELNAGNAISAINIWAIPVIRYTAGVVEWTVNELREADRKTRKLLTMNNAFNLNGDVDRLYVARSKGGKGLLQIEQMVREEERSLEEYVKTRQKKDRLLQMVAKEHLFNTNESKAEYKQRVTEQRIQDWKAKRLHGQFHRQTADVVDEEESVRWITAGYMKKGTESLLMAAQEQSLRTRYIKYAIDKANIDPKCRWCGSTNETVQHLIAGCSVLVNSEYKARHNKVASIIHWRLCQKFEIDVHKNWYRHEPHAVIENDKVKILWDVNIYTDRVIQARRPDIVVVDKAARRVTLIDIAVPADKNVVEKEKEKITKYQDLKMELQRLWQMKVRVVPVVVGALGGVPKDLKKWLKELDLEDADCSALQKAALLGTAKILRRTLVL